MRASGLAFLLLLLPAACANKLDYEQVKAQFDGNRPRYVQVAKALEDCGVDVLRIDGRMSVDEPCVSGGESKARTIEAELKALGVEYVTVDFRDLGRGRFLHNINFILQRDLPFDRKRSRSIFFVTDPRDGEARPPWAPILKKLSLPGWYYRETLPD